MPTSTMDLRATRQGLAPLSDEKAAGRERRDNFPAIEEMLLRADPEQGFRGSLVGDLDDLAFTLDQIRHELAALFAESGKLGREEVRRRLYGLEIRLEEDLPMVIADVLPALNALRQRQ